MLTEKELEKALEALMGRLDEVNSFYIKKVCEQIAKIGGLNQSSINRLSIMAEMVDDINQITNMLEETSRLNAKDVMKIFQSAVEELYTDQRFSRYLKDHPLPQEAKARLNHYVQTVARQTGQSMVNLSNTTAISETYRDAADKAILATSTGLGSYTETMRDTIRKIGYNGMQVQYESGYHRRLDSAVRQNIIDGVNQINQHGSILMGEALGFDAYEISAHANSAPDHEPVQGRVFLKEEFEKMQAGLSFSDTDGNHYPGFRRPIGEWNCMHIAMSFSTKYSVRRYTPEQLEKWASDNAKGCEIDGKHYTMYEATQLMRSIETEVRRQKDTANAAKAAGDTTLQENCQKRINDLAEKYADVCKASGLPSKKQRMSVEGFKAVKVDSEPTERDAKIHELMSVGIPERGDGLKKLTITRELRKSEVGRSALEYIESRNIYVDINYTNEVSRDMRGRTFGSGIEVFARNTVSARVTAETIIHECTHIRLGTQKDTRWEEAYCIAQEHKHTKPTLTWADLKSIIKEVNDLYSELPWR